MMNAVKKYLVSSVLTADNAFVVEFEDGVLESNCEKALDSNN